MTSLLTTFASLSYKINRFHVAVRLFSRSQMTSKCGRNISDSAAPRVPLFCSYNVGWGVGMGYSLYWTIRNGSARKRNLFQEAAGWRYIKGSGFHEPKYRK